MSFLVGIAMIANIGNIPSSEIDESKEISQ